MDEVNQENEVQKDFNASKIQERMEKRHQARIEDTERRKEAKQSQAVSEEKSEYFSSTFSSQKAGIEELLSGCAGADRAAVTQKLEEATNQTLQLQKFLNDSVMFLTQYELKQAQGALQKLQTTITEIREEALPKKKFTFRARSKAADKGLAEPDDAPPPNTEKDADTGITKTSVASPTRTTGLDEDCRGDPEPGRAADSPDQLTLHLKHISSCEILCGPVSTSVFVDHCSNSTLAFACQQLRTHNTTDTQVYLHVTSRAIIEDCRGLGFAPFSWSYPTMDQDFTVSGLDRNRNNWNQVDDFNWLAAGTHSPNWTVIPEEDRRTSWDL
ncbi:Tubulin-specific chaperone C [Oryzias melastigma]|uniref:Tubulin-specific chaperone C n=1 Tax=Oryzias melastigma TaxID=30732 RepID=A0A834BTJ4_ORYME|nr:Tubulin-specific chaperone C [Oryzias melastigma]